MYQKFDITPFNTFKQQYSNNLKEPSCLIGCIEELCGGWTQETLKSILQKLTKKNQAPLPLFFDSSESMDAISNKKNALLVTFQQFDSRGIGRIDATELFSIMLLTSKGDFSQICYNIANMFGSDQTNNMTQDEFFFFLDSLFRGLSKVLICKGETKPAQVNKRLNDSDLNKFVTQVFKQQPKINKEDLYQNIVAVVPLYEFLYNAYSHMQTSLEYSRDEQLKMMKITLEVKKVMTGMLIEIEKRAK
ncbi:hypothetical protein pb186bvf_003060 [Paramecium bursaria]